MKLSIAWIFDHIDADWQRINITELAKKFNATTAEIEKVFPISFDLNMITLVETITITDNTIVVFSPELGKQCTLPFRKDVTVGGWYLIKNMTEWLSMSDIGGTKDLLLPEVYCNESERSGGWKKDIESTDYILEVDNKSITNRPDMWGHRGFAREVAALLNFPLKPFSEFSYEIPVEQHDKQAPATTTNPFFLSIKPNECNRFAGVFLPAITYRPSLISMAFRLARVDAKPIDAIVDCTNYVMLDTSQPTHAFDADKIPLKRITPEMARAGEKLLLLDGKTITLTTNDLIISDGEKPIALAGIMGGESTAICKETRAVFLESASFDATTIRQNAARHKIRTEASARFEKTLDPNQNIQAINRFIKLVYDAGLIKTVPAHIVSCGKPAEKKTIPILYGFLAKRLGVQLDTVMVTSILEQLEFKVDQIDETVFTVTIPTFRGSKDVSIKEDILEEVGRFYGYTNIITELPSQQLAPSPLHAVYQRRRIKSVMSTALEMHELESYSFYDEDFLRRLQFEPTGCISVQSPVSENWRRLVTSLMPHLFKAIEQNSADYDQLRFFEWARIWHKNSTPEETVAIERKSLAGIFFNKKEPVDFYESKSVINQFFSALHMPVSWHQIESPTDPWFTPYQTASIKYNETVIGTFGVIDPLFLQSISLGYACAFEFDGDFLLQYQPKLVRYAEPSKYPSVERDISILVSIEKTVDSLIEMIKSTHTDIICAQLVDCFEKKEWTNQRALTFRLTIQDTEKTLTKDEAEQIYNAIADKCKKIGATIR